MLKPPGNLPGPFGRLASLPRTELGHGPTPLEALPNLTRQCGGPELLVKRDDFAALAFGGNKVRQLEYYFGAASAIDADTILITGAVQSNFVRMAAAAARKLGMDIHIQLEERVADTDSTYRNSGNVLLDRLFGATLYAYPDGEDEAGADRRIREIADELRDAGRNPYVIPLAAGHPPLGALGYVLAAQEFLQQSEERDLDVDEIFVGSGSGATHAGLLFGLRALGSMIRVRGICVRRAAEPQVARILSTCNQIALLLETEPCVTEADVQVDDAFLAPGYGVPNPPTLAAIVTAARTEGLILDPVYTGKTMAGMLHRATEEDAAILSLLFWHTGGTPAIFAYRQVLEEVLGSGKIRD